jgi:hypothetical protein
MGGLIARRMILDTEAQVAGPHPLVRRLITAGTPFWGAPKANYVIETGDVFGLPRLNAAFPGLARMVLKETARKFPALHQLLPSKALFDATQPNLKPFGEGAPGLFKLGTLRFWDINQNGQLDDNYSYDMYKAMINNYRPFFSGAGAMTNNETFHGFINPFGSKQDDWNNDTTGVEYYHLVGVGLKTPVKVQAMTLTGASNLLPGKFKITLDGFFLFEEGSGDGTVPRLSAERTRQTNAPQATHQIFKGLDHVQLVSAKAAIDCILKFLGVGNTCQRSEPTFQAGLLPASRHILLVNVQNVQALDASGNPVDVLGDALLPSYGDTSAILSMPPDQEVFIYFQTLSRPGTPVMARVMTTGDAENFVRKTLYFDAQLRNDFPPEPTENMLGHLYIDSQGDTQLRFDWNRDGVINTSDNVVSPTVDSIDPGVVVDALGPAIQITGIRQENGARYITLDASDPSGILADTGVGTPPFLVSLENDEMVIDNLVKYTIGDEVVVPPGFDELTACAVDRAGNRLCEVFVIP